MGLLRYFRAVKEQTIQNRLSIIIGLVIVVLLFGLLNFWFGMEVKAGVRAYVGGEGLWSKAQKTAVIHLNRYVDSHDKSDYQAFLRSIEVQLGDRQAKLEMNKPKPDMAVVRDGFIKGGNHPDDVDDLYFLYRWFKNISYMKSAIQTWDDGDKEIANLLDAGERIHQVVTSTTGATTPETITARDTELASLLREVDVIDARLTVLENRFSAVLGEGARQITKMLMISTIVITVLLGLLSLTVAIMITRAIVRLDRQKSEFVALASHQLRTPLTAMKWSAELLATRFSDGLSPMQQKYVTKMHEGSKRMAALIGDLVSVSSLDLGTFQSDQKEINMADFLKTVVGDQQKKIAEKNISLTMHVDPDIPPITTDVQPLTSVLQNIISNSIKYTRRGGWIEIHAEAKKNHLLIRVSDNGIGIPASQQPRIFTKLFRADNARAYNFNEGTGLGLYIAKAMAARIGGKVWFDSTENKGSTFYVKIPI